MPADGVDGEGAASSPSIPPLASTSSLPFPSSPKYPSTFRTASGNSTQRHSRIPSRSERYDTLVEGARGLLRDTVGTHKPEEDAWRECVGSLLTVIDGMARQLSTHDELAAQLKIAQSNLTLAETHTEFLEETLRRHSQSATPRPRATTSHSDRPPSTAMLAGLGFEEFDPTPPKPGFFGRLPRTKHKLTPSTTSASSVPSVDSPRTSETWGEQGEVAELRGTVGKLQQANGALETTTKALEGRCAELEQTKDELMGELESLSVELFEEANKMVAEERKARARAEDEVARLGEELRSGRDGEGAALRRAEEDLERALGLGGDASSLGRENGFPPSLSPLQIPSRPLEDRSESTTPVDSGTSLRKWFNFGRAGTKQNSLDVPAVPTPHLMSRVHSATSTRTTDSRMSASSDSSFASSSAPFPDELELDAKTPKRPTFASRHIIPPLSIPRCQAPISGLDLFANNSPIVTSPSVPTPPSKSPANLSFPFDAFSPFSFPHSSSLPPSLPPRGPTSTSPPLPFPDSLAPAPLTIDIDTTDYPTPSTDFPPEAAYSETLFSSPPASLYPLPPSPSPSLPSLAPFPPSPSLPASPPLISPTRLSSRTTRHPTRLPKLDLGSARERALASLDSEARSPRSPNAARWRQKVGFPMTTEPVPRVEEGRVWKPQSWSASASASEARVESGRVRTSRSTLLSTSGSVGSMGTGKSIDDLEALMRNISSMSETFFGEGGDWEETAGGEGGGEKGEKGGRT